MSRIWWINFKEIRLFLAYGHFSGYCLVYSNNIRTLMRFKAMKRACIAVFTNEDENNFSYLLDFRAQNILHASSIRPFKKNF